MKSYDYRFRVPMHHVDHAGILFYANLFIHAHDAWEAFMRSIDCDLAQMIKDGQWGLPIVHAEADYMQPMRHGDEVDVSLQIEHLGRSSLRAQFLFAGHSGVQLAVARTTHVFVDADKHQSAEIPDDLRTQLLPYSMT